MKLILTFCVYGISNIVNYSAYSVSLKREGAFSKELEQYFDCESMGVSFGKTCDRDAFERLDPTEFTLTSFHDFVHADANHNSDLCCKCGEIHQEMQAENI